MLVGVDVITILQLVLDVSYCFGMCREGDEDGGTLGEVDPYCQVLLGVRDGL